MAAVIVKLKAERTPADAAAVVRSIVGPALRTIEPLFPDNPDPELATMFTLTLARPGARSRVVAALEKDPRIEYAHTPATRGPR